MTTAKTAISLESTLLEQTDKLAKETGNSRSGVIAIALQKYFSELEQQKILEQLNLVYEDDTKKIALERSSFIANYYRNDIYIAGSKCDRQRYDKLSGVLN